MAPGPFCIPIPRHAPRAEDNAIVLLGNIDGLRILLFSHLGHQGQLALLSRTNDLRADILVTALPDQTEISAEPFSETLLDATQPRVIIVHDTAAHHASERLISQLRRRRIPILYTSQTQAITLTTRPNHWQLSKMNELMISDGKIIQP